MVSVSINFNFWRKKNMYKSMKILIGKHFYKTADAAQNKLDVFFAVSRMNQEEYEELTALVQDVYSE